MVLNVSIKYHCQYVSIMSLDHFKHLNVCDDSPAMWPTRLLLKVSLCTLLYTQFWGQIDFFECFECANNTMHLHHSQCECALCIQVFHIVWDWEHTLEDFRGFTFNFSATPVEFTGTRFSVALLLSSHFYALPYFPNACESHTAAWHCGWCEERLPFLGF